MRIAEFLTDLRSNRPARPNGSRPLPNSSTTATPTCGPEPPARTSSALSRPVRSVNQLDRIESDVPERSASAMSHRREQSAFSTQDMPNGRPLARQPDMNAVTRDFSTSTRCSRAPPSATYFERGDRWIEKQEARSLRIALEDMDLKSEQRIHAAAQDEASDLVWKHQNPEASHRDQYAPYDYKFHLRQGSYARSQNTGRYSAFGMRNEGQQQETNRSSSNAPTSKPISNGSDTKGSRDVNENRIEGSGSKDFSENDTARSKISIELSSPLAAFTDTSHGQSGRSNSLQDRSMTEKGLFRNPNDRIYEEPEEIEQSEVLAQDTQRPAPLRLKDKNPSSRFSSSRRTPTLSDDAPLEAPNKISRSEIYRNPPSQSRNPSYLKNALPPTPPDSANASDSDNHPEKPFSKNGIEIRSDDIRAATSMRLKDRSPKLPTPTMVSDRPGRPIVSFDRNYRTRETVLERIQPHSRPPVGSTRTIPALLSKPPLPESIVSAPIVPTINILESPSIKVNDGSPIPVIQIPDIPSISVSSSDIPTIAFSPSHNPSISVSEPNNLSRPLPTSTNRSNTSTKNQRLLPHHSPTTPTFSRPQHWSQSSHRATAQCAACALPIAGRIVSAASQRFHPACFNCFQCGELLECVAFYPEPDAFRTARLSRIYARLNNEPISEGEANQYSEEDDGDDGLRFFCHLDFHEKFSPRCRSCKTPIEGEVVIACGGEWHVGHFFCAECGDPFDSKTPFVEKNGYAWCVNCHCKRFSGKCAGCKRPITDMVVKALGREWHEGCFCCKVCILPNSSITLDDLADLAFSNAVVSLRTANFLLEAKARILFVFVAKRGD